MAEYEELGGVLGRGILQEAWRVMSELGIQMHTVWIRYNQITPGNAWMTPLMKQQRINDTYYELFQNMMELYNRLFYGIFANNYVIPDDPSSSWWNPNMTGDAGFNADVAYRHFLRIFDLYGYGVDTDAGIKLIEQDVGMKILDQMLGQHFEFGLTEAEQQLMRMRAEITGDYAKYFDTEDEFSRRVTQVLMGGSGGLGDALGTLDDIAARPGTYSDLQKDLDNLEQERRTRLDAVKQKLARSEISQASYNQEVNSINEDINRRKQQLEKGEGSTGSANNLIEGLYQLFQQGIISDIEFYKYATEGYYVGNPQNIITEIYQNSVIGEARFNRVIDHVEADGTPVFKTLNGSYAKKMEELKRKFLLHGDSFNAQTGNWVAGTASNTAGVQMASSKIVSDMTLKFASEDSYIVNGYNGRAVLTADLKPVDGIQEILNKFYQAMVPGGRLEAIFGVLGADESNNCVEPLLINRDDPYGKQTYSSDPQFAIRGWWTGSFEEGPDVWTITSTTRTMIDTGFSSEGRSDWPGRDFGSDREIAAGYMDIYSCLKDLIRKVIYGDGSPGTKGNGGLEALKNAKEQNLRDELAWFRKNLVSDFDLNDGDLESLYKDSINLSGLDRK